MKRLKSLLPYDYVFIALALLLTVYFKNIIILLGIIIYALIKKRYKEILVLLILLTLCGFRMLLYDIKPNLAIINKVDTNAYIATNFNYDIKVYTDQKLELNELILIENAYKNKQKDNIYYKASEVKKLFTIKSFRNILLDKIQDDFSGSYLNKMLYGNYDDDISDITISASLYFFYISLKRLFYKFKPYDCILTLIILIALFGLPYKMIKIIILVLCYEYIKKRSLALSASMIVMILLYPSMITSYSFILSFLIRYLVLFSHRLSFWTIMVFIQSLFFYYVEPFMLMMFAKIMNLRLVLCILFIITTFLGINLDFIEPYYLFFYEILHIEIKGQVNIILIFIFIYLIKHFKIKNHLLESSLAILLILSNVSNLGSMIIVSDVNQGDAIILKSPLNNEVILIDTGSKYNYHSLSKSLNKRGIYKIDYLILSHSDEDHIGNLKRLVKDYEVINIIYEHKDVDARYFKLYSLNDNNYDNPNDNSLVYYLNYNKLNYLFTGDISINVEKDIINRYPNLKVDLLKLGHHGSKTSTSIDILRDYEVRLALISSDYRIYKHPSKEVTDRLKELEIEYFSTDQTGEIVILNFFNINIVKTGFNYYLIRK